MSLSAREFDVTVSRFAKVLTPFFMINIIVSILLLLQPLAIPIFLAEFCLLAIWSAWGPGDFWKRFATCLGVGTLFFLTQIYLWIMLLSISRNPRVIVVLIQWLFSAWILAQIPLWGLRYIWQWRITTVSTADLQRFSVNDNIIGMTMICFSLGSCRWATDFLVSEYGPFGYETVWSFYAGALLEFYLLIGLAGFGTWLTYRLRSRATIIVPMMIVGGWIAIFSAWLWFPSPERWIAAGVIWVGLILFSWAVILPIRYVKNLGYSMYQGKSLVGYE